MKFNLKLTNFFIYIYDQYNLEINNIDETAKKTMKKRIIQIATRKLERGIKAKQ